jgi:3-deoxy-D-manno-octulosonic-acid transferase
MRLIYSALLYLLAPFLLLRLCWHGVTGRESWWRIPERFGHVPRPQNGVAVWVHAVSVGESMAALPLIRRLVAMHPPGSVLVTTSTPTGSAQVQAALRGQVQHCYAPYDLPHAVRRFVMRMRPQRVIVMETELWPNLFRALAVRRIPLVIASARLSPRSFAAYRRLRHFTAATLADCALIAAQSEADGGRFIALGAPAARVQVMGNLKFDFEMPAELVTRGRELRQRLGAGRPVWAAASTHEGEDEFALTAHRILLKRFPQALLILVPRHPQRFEAVAKLVERSGLAFSRRSSGEISAESPVFLADSMGELPVFLAAADVAFIGGSLVPVGGHNVLEPAVLGIPALFGPHMFNFEHARNLLLSCQAARQIESALDLAPAVTALFSDPAKRAAMGQAGREAVADNRGALERLMKLLETI